MTDLLHLPRLKRRNRSVDQPLSDSFDWPQKALEEIVGIPDILNEKLADNLVREIQKQQKEDNHAGFSRQRS